MKKHIVGTIKPTDSKQKPKAMCKDKVIGTRKGIERIVNRQIK